MTVWWPVDDPPIEMPEKLHCNGICVMAHEVIEPGMGVPMSLVAYPHPECALHSWGDALVPNEEEIVAPPNEEVGIIVCAKHGRPEPCWTCNAYLDQWIGDR